MVEVRQDQYEGEIVIIEDNSACGILYRDTLIDAGINESRIRTFGSVEEFETYLEQSKKCPSLVMLDLRLSHQPGFVLLKKMQEGDYPCKDTPVIVISVDDKTDTQEACKNLGAKAFFSKPDMEIARLQACVQTLLHETN